MSEIVVRHVENKDAEALHQLFSHPAVYRDTLQLPLPSKTHWQQRIAEVKPGTYSLVACIDEQVVGQMTVELIQRIRRRHAATFGLCVHAHYHGQGIGSALMNAMLDICDNWGAIERIELTVFTDNQSAIALYSSYFKLLGCWLPSLTPVTYLSKLLGLRSVAAYKQLELFWVYTVNLVSRSKAPAAALPSATANWLMPTIWRVYVQLEAC